MALYQEREPIPEDTPVRVIDYEQSTYRTAFWRNADRRYEDAAERLALRRMLPPTGRRIVDLGAGFGRLADEYRRYEQVVLFDYSRSMLAQAVERWGHDRRFVFVAGSVYAMPFVAHSMEVVVMVRVMHHLAEGLTALQEIDRVLQTGGTAVLEFANKRNLKSMLRHMWRGQAWSPYAPDPVEFAEMHFNFHPRWMQEQLGRTRLRREAAYSVSHLRLPALQRLLPTGWLAQGDSLLFRPGGKYPLGPSVFLQTRRQGARRAPVAAPGPDVAAADWLQCPLCRTATLTQPETTALTCTQCETAFRQEAGIWDFKTALPGESDRE